MSKTFITTSTTSRTHHGYNIIHKKQCLFFVCSYQLELFRLICKLNVIYNQSSKKTSTTTHCWKWTNKTFCVCLHVHTWKSSLGDYPHWKFYFNHINLNLWIYFFPASQFLMNLEHNAMQQSSLFRSNSCYIF